MGKGISERDCGGKGYGEGTVGKATREGGRGMRAGDYMAGGMPGERERGRYR